MSIKKWISICCAGVLLVSMFSVPTTASSEDSATQTEQDVSYNGTTALGDAVADALNDSAASDKDNYGYFIEEVTVDGLTATVTLSAPDASTVLVALYDEETGVMVTSGKAAANEDTDTLTVSLAACDMPTYFIINAFLLDSHHAPICASYESRHYTAAFAEYISKTVFDFDEDRVINLDYGYESNFAVVADEAAVVTAATESNILVTNDYENGIYAFANANSDITSLQEGDILYFVYGDGEDDYLLTKIGSIAEQDGIVTVTAAEDCEMSELFSYIKIDTEQYVSEEEAYAVASLAAEGTYDDEAGNVNEISPEQSIEITEEFEGDLFDVSFSGVLKLQFDLQFYYDFQLFGEDYYEISQKVTLSFTAATTISFTAKPSKDIEPFVVFCGGIPIVAGIEAEVELSIKIIPSAQLSVTGGIEISMSYGSKKIAGYDDQDLSTKPSIKLTFSAEGKLSVDIDPYLSVGFKVLKVISVNLTGGATFTISGTVKTEIDSGGSLTLPDERHECMVCIDGDITLTPHVDIEVKFGIRKKKQKTVLKITLFSVTYNLGDFYISSRDIGENLPALEFGFGPCPYLTYKTTFLVSDSDGNPLAGARLSDDCNFYTTNSNGQTVGYLPRGTHQVAVTLNGYELDTTGSNTTHYTFAVIDSALTVSIPMRRVATDNSPADPDDGAETKPSAYNFIDPANGYLADGGEHVTINSDGSWTITGAVALAPQLTIDYTRYSDLVLKMTNDVPVKITILDRDPNGVYEDHWIGLYDNWFEGGVENFPADSYDFVGDFKSIFDWNIAYSGWSNINSQATIRAIYIEPDASGTVTLDALYLTGVTEVSNFQFNVLDGDTIEIIGYTGQKSELVIPSSLNGYTVTSIGDSAFYGNETLTSVTIPDTVTRIGILSFRDCINLETVSLGNNVSIIDDTAFERCLSLTSVTIPDSVTTIGRGAFGQCSSLSSVSISNSVTSIGSGAFQSCSSLTSITIPDSVTNLGDWVFEFCSKLTSATFGSGLTSIGTFVFYSCDSLETVTIPDSITGIGEMTFYMCNALARIYYSGTQEQWNRVFIGFGNDPLSSAAVICGATVSTTDVYLSGDTAANSATAATLNDAQPGYSYILLVVRDPLATDLLSADNLLYVAQQYADSDTLTVPYVLSDGIATYDTLFFGALLPCVHLTDDGVATPPTCTQAGYITYTCTLCKESYRQETDPATAQHLIENGVCTQCGEAIVADVLPGDMNGDGTLNMMDALLLYAVAGGTAVLEDSKTTAADYNSDGTVNMMDAVLLYAKASGN